VNDNQIKDVNIYLKKLVNIREQLKENPKDKSLRLKYKKMQEECIIMLEYLVDWRTKRYKQFPNYEDLYQEGRCALLMAMSSYNPDRGDFIWWANKYVKTKISREANKHSTIKIPLKKAGKEPPYKVISMPVFFDETPSAIDNLTNREVNQSVHTAINKLPIEQQQIIIMYFGVHETDRSKSIGAICNKLNISRQNAIKLLQDAKINLATQLSDVIP
jgi:RNA polymerase sigma factor (sigma-70 family)